MSDKFLPDLWALNEKYPDYIRCVEFDHISPPSYNIEQCKKLFTQKLQSAIDRKHEDLRDQIEVAEEQEMSTKELLAERKSIRDLLNIDISRCKAIEDIEILKPDELLEYWK